MKLVPAFDQLTNAVAETYEEIQRTIKKLRGETVDSATSSASAQANFAILTAQARSGNKQAIADLPGMAESLVETVSRTAKSGADVRWIKAMTANSLEETLRVLGVNSYDAGTNYVPKDGLAYIHEGEAVVPARYNDAVYGTSGSSGSGDVAKEINEMRYEIRAIAGHTAKTAKILDDITPNRTALDVRVTG